MSELNEITETKHFIKINGELREVKFRMSAWAELEKEYGSLDNIDKLLSDVEKRPFQTLPKLAYIGLIDKSGVVVETCLDDYSLRDIEEVTKTITNALFESLPETEKKTKKVKAV